MLLKTVVKIKGSYDYTSKKTGKRLKIYVLEDENGNYTSKNCDGDVVNVKEGGLARAIFDLRTHKGADNKVYEYTVLKKLEGMNQ